MNEAADAPPRDRAEVGRQGDAIVLLAILSLAAAIRFVGLEGRGTWDADQGHDMLVLRDFVTAGQVPLLGPPTSIGTFHHGALYYWLLAPAALIAGSDPVGVTAAIALAGLVTVAATWWLGRQIGGPLAGHLAGLLTAISPAAIEQSTFIWNPNLIPAFASIALASAWRARSTGQGRWWVAAAVAAGIVMQCHVLGIILLPPIVALWVSDVRRADPAHRTRLVRAGLIGIALIALMYVPLLVYELTHDFAETRAIVAWIASGGGAGPPFLERLPIVAWRVLAWPVSGLISDRPILALAAVAVVVAALVWRLIARNSESTAIRWLGGTLLWAILALTVAAPSLATIVPDLPNDHYHAFVDPVVLVIVALAIAGLDCLRRQPVGRLAAAGALVAVAGIEVSALPPGVAWDGGWPAARAAAARVASVTGDRTAELLSLPSLKSADALRFPLERLPHGQRSGRAIVVVCDPRLASLIGAECGGPAEDPLAAGLRLADRFVASPQRTISVYVE